MLLKDGSVSIHHENILNLANEMFEVKNHLSPEIVADTLFQQPQTQYYLRYHKDFRTPSRSVYCQYKSFENRNV